MARRVESATGIGFRCSFCGSIGAGAERARMTYHRRRTAWHLAFARYFVASFLLVFAAAALYGCWNAAKAHGEAAWIMQSDETRWCCGPEDCAQLPDSDVTPLGPSAWRINSTGQVFRQGDKGVYPSKRAGFWACRRPEGFVCFFFDGGAT